MTESRTDRSASDVRRIPLPLLILILISGPLLIALIGTAGPNAENGVEFNELLERLDPEALFRMIIVPQGIVGIAALVLTIVLGWRSFVRLRLPQSAGQWIVGLIPLVAVLAVIDYGYLGGKGSTSAVLVFVAFGIVGFTEELIFRGIGLAGFQQHVSTKKAVFFSSAIFGVSHLLNVLYGKSIGEAAGQAVMTTMMGMVFGLLCLKTGSLIMAMLVHGAWDVMVVTRLESAGIVEILVALAVIIVGVTVLTKVRTQDSFSVALETA